MALAVSVHFMLSWIPKGMIMKRRIFTILGLMAMTLNATAQTNATQPLATLDALVQQWMQLRTTIATEQTEWEQQRQQWQQEIALLQQESQILQQEIDADQANHTDTENQHANLLAKQSQLEQEREELRKLFERSATYAQAWLPRIPPSLRQNLQKNLALLGESPQTEQSLTEKAQTLVALYSQIESLQNQIHQVTAMIQTDDHRQQADVLYIGLAQAFAVSPGDDWAAIGRPTQTGWHWQSAPQHAQAIRQAIRVFSRQQIASLVTLPLQIQSMEQP